MAGTSLYDADWLPGLGSDFDDEGAVDLGLDWLESVDCPGPGVIVMNEIKINSRRVILGLAAVPRAEIEQIEA
jgi:hypothetical protein